MKNIVLLCLFLIPIYSMAKSNPNQINVLDFGAKGDNKHNDTKAFQKALIHLQNENISTLIIPNGNYLIDSLIIENLKGKTILGGGAYHCRLIPRINIETFIYFGTTSKSNKQRLIKACVSNKVSGIRIHDSNNLAKTAIQFTNCQDNIFELIDIRHFDTGIKIKQSWVNTFTNIKVTNYSHYGFQLLGQLNANLFQSTRCASGKNPNAVAYKIEANSTTFTNCVAEGNGIGWEFYYAKITNLIGCHSEHLTPFKISGKSDIININGQLIWRPNKIWEKTNRIAEAITFSDSYIYLKDKKKLLINIPAKNISEKNLLQITTSQ